MKNEKGIIAFISVLNIILTLIFVFCYINVREKIEELFSVPIFTEKPIILCIAFIFSLFAFDLIIIAFILLLRNGFFSVIVYNVSWVCTIFFAVFGFMFGNTGEAYLSLLLGTLLIIVLLHFAKKHLDSDSTEEPQEYIHREKTEHENKDVEREACEPNTIIASEKLEKLSQELEKAITSEKLEELSQKELEKQKIINRILRASSIDLCDFLKENNLEDHKICIAKINSYLSKNKDNLLRKSRSGYCLYNKAVKLTYNITDESVKDFVNDLELFIKNLNEEYPCESDVQSE